MRKSSRIALCVLMLVASVAVAAEQKVAISIHTDRPEAVYEKGEDVTFLIELTEDDQPVDGAEVKCELSTDGFLHSEVQPLVLAGGTAAVTASRDESCLLWIRVTYEREGEKPVKKVAGAAISPEGIEPSMPVPDDFDEFWSAKIAELNETPVNAQVEPMEGAPEGFEFYKVTLDGYKGTKIYCYLAKPEGDGPFPAMLRTQWAGVYSLQPGWALNDARQGFICLNINAHAIENGKPEQYYRDLNDGALKGYAHQGRESRETSYFLRMFLSCVRAADYLASRPDWDGEHFIVGGGSQGGGQAIVTAALSPHVTAMIANVPALCDHTATLVGRMPGWPRLTGWSRQQPAGELIDAVRYFDVVNFASRMRVPALVGTGFGDLTCSSSGVYAAYNVMQGPKQMVADPLTGHNGAKHNFGRARGDFALEHSGKR